MCKNDFPASNKLNTALTKEITSACILEESVSQCKQNSLSSEDIEIFTKTPPQQLFFIIFFHHFLRFFSFSFKECFLMFFIFILFLKQHRLHQLLLTTASQVIYWIRYKLLNPTLPVFRDNSWLLKPSGEQSGKAFISLSTFQYVMFSCSTNAKKTCNPG